MPLTSTLVTAPATLVVSVAELKTHARIDHDFEDDLLADLIPAATEWAENATERSFFTQTWKLCLDAFPCSGKAIRPPRSPLASVSSISYTDSSGVSQTLAANQYQVDAVSEPGRILPAYGVSWPATRGVLNAVTITYVAGWTAATMPEKVKQLVKFVAAHYYANREPVITGTIVAEFPLAVQSLVHQLQVGSYR